jgi:methyltransferase family protein
MNRKEIRDLERSSIRAFVKTNDVYLMGRVLDFGAGKPGTCHEPQPYRRLVRGHYEAYDKGDKEPRGVFDAILCTQVLQSIPNPLATLTWMAERTTWLVLTYPTHWEELDRAELYRFTKAGMEYLLKTAGFEVRIHERRWQLPYDDFELAGGYGVVAESHRRLDHA